MSEKGFISARLRQQVIERARGRCEYCLLHSDDANYFPHEIDHIIAEQHGGLTIPENLALSCFFCNHHKGPNIASIDPQTKKVVTLFNPRTQQWNRHFRLNGPHINPFTINGRVTVFLLQLNDSKRIDERLALMTIGHYPRK